MLRADVAFQKKEMLNLQTDSNTIISVAETQHKDIERYLAKECRVMDEIVIKQKDKQNVEYQKYQNSVNDVFNIVAELDDSRLECVQKLTVVE